MDWNQEGHRVSSFVEFKDVGKIYHMGEVENKTCELLY